MRKIRKNLVPVLLMTTVMPVVYALSGAGGTANLTKESSEKSNYFAMNNGRIDTKINAGQIDLNPARGAGAVNASNDLSAGGQGLDTSRLETPTKRESKVESAISKEANGRYVSKAGVTKKRDIAGDDDEYYEEEDEFDDYDDEYYDDEEDD